MPISFPKKYRQNDVPTAVFRWIDQLVPLMIEGEHPVLITLREQFRRARVKEVVLTGVGFCIDFEIPPNAPLTEPAHFKGGDVAIPLEGGSSGAGCVLFIRDHRLAFLDGYTYGNDEWPEDAVILSVEDVVPAFWDGRPV